VKIVHGRDPGSATEERGPTFDGTVWADPILPPTDGVMINAVFFTPSARTHWHRHEHGQILQVTTGSGWVCSEGGPPERLVPGDVVWVPPGERHWHGAATDSAMAHVAISLGTTQWESPVSEQDYLAAQGKA
jgi:quercetin dioxygenase-like cupin family protein